MCRLLGRANCAVRGRGLAFIAAEVGRDIGDDLPQFKKKYGWKPGGAVLCLANSNVLAVGIADFSDALVNCHICDSLPQLY